MDILVGIFGIGQYLKGDKDLFVLCCVVLGVLCIIVEKNLDFDLQMLIEEVVCLYGEKLINVNVVDDVIDFMLGCFCVWYQDEGYGVDMIQVVLVCCLICLVDFDVCMKVVLYFCILEEFFVLVVVNKCVFNIFVKFDEMLNDIVYVLVLKEVVEIKLVGNLVVLCDKLQLYFVVGCYQDVLIELVVLCELVDEFFENVMVNVEDKDVCINCLMLLFKLCELFLQVVDIFLLQ